MSGPGDYVSESGHMSCLAALARPRRAAIQGAVRWVVAIQGPPCNRAYCVGPAASESFQCHLVRRRSASAWPPEPAPSKSRSVHFFLSYRGRIDRAAIPLQAGQVRSFSESGLGHQGLGSGWDSGNQAEIQLRLEAGPGPAPGPS